MTQILNSPSSFAADATAGLVRLNSHLLESVYGGVVRATETPEGKVAVVIGGGSGHYPAFSGWVGPGMADGSVVGNVFASPSTAQIYSVARAANRGGGVFFSYGNYAGDVLNFDMAQDRLRAEGIPTQTVTVTDDITSATREEKHRRRGTAGDLVVFKIASAAAEAGYDLDAVTAVASRANGATQSFAVAFAGCTLPGAAEPLFEVPVGQMGVGMGVHGEPGISEQALLSASELAKLLVEHTLSERPEGASGRVIALLNGLGASKYEELFVLWNEVAPLLAEAGLEVIEPEVGELITSLDMAGVSLTITWLDEELETLWRAPAESPAFHRGAAMAAAPRTRNLEGAAAQDEVAPASDASRDAAQALLATARAVQTELLAAEQELGDLDAIAGDGDHGRGMTAGVDAAVTALASAVDQGAGVRTALARAGDAWGDRAGGTSGALWGTALRAASTALSDDEAPSPADIAAATRAALDHVLTFGKARRGDKTLLDSLIPFTETLEGELASGGDLAAAWSVAGATAKNAAQATASLTPRIGRARPLAARSVGHPDPGAVSLALVLDVATPKA